MSDKTRSNMRDQGRQVLEELRSYLQYERNRPTTSLSSTQVSVIPKRAGPRARRCVGIKPALLDDFPHT